MVPVGRPAAGSRGVRSGVTLTQHGLSSNKMALITSYCGAMRTHEHQIALITSECVPFRAGRTRSASTPARPSDCPTMTTTSTSATSCGAATPTSQPSTTTSPAGRSPHAMTGEPRRPRARTRCATTRLGAVTATAARPVRPANRPARPGECPGGAHYSLPHTLSPVRTLSRTHTLSPVHTQDGCHIDQIHELFVCWWCSTIAHGTWQGGRRGGAALGLRGGGQPLACVHWWG